MANAGLRRVERPRPASASALAPARLMGLSGPLLEAYEDDGYPVDIHPQAGMDESKPAPEQGYAGMKSGDRLVEHNENTTATKDWLHEYGPHLRKPAPPKKSSATTRASAKVFGFERPALVSVPGAFAVLLAGLL